MKALHLSVDCSSKMEAARSSMSEHALTRRKFLCSAAYSSAAFFIGGTMPSAFAAATYPEIKTRTHRIHGRMEGPVNRFLGVPYAQAPSEGLRFHAPQPLATSTKPISAGSFAAGPMQSAIPNATLSEDCLYLNIWAPAESGPHPVFFWIHGGGFLSGQASERLFWGDEFARQGIVLVTEEYRLGVFGFLDFEPLLGSQFAGSANNGLLDLVEALRWVHENIAAFGGDPAMVTIGGESAGAKLTALLMATPAAQGLFSGAISESGGADRAFPRATSLKVAEGFGKCWQQTTGLPIAAMQSAPAQQLITVQDAFLKSWPVHFPLRAEIDGRVLPAAPLELIHKHSAGLRLLIGTNHDESAAFLGAHPSALPEAGDLGNMTLANFERKLADYAQLYPQLSTERRRIAATTAEEYWIPSLRVAEAVASNRGKVWMYRFDLAKLQGPMAGNAAHAAELGLVWSHPTPGGVDGGRELSLSRSMHDCWVKFLKGQVPGTEVLPAWPAFTLAERHTMILDEHSRIEAHPAEAERKLWEGELTQPASF